MALKRKFFSGESIDQALLQAARYFKLEPAEIDYEEIQKRHGFLKVRRKVMIAVSLENPRKAAAPAAEEAPARAPAARPPETAGEPAAPAIAESPPPAVEEASSAVAEAPAVEEGPSPVPEPPHPAREVDALAPEGPPPAETEIAPPAGPARRRRRRRSRRDLVELPDAPRRAIERFPRATGAQAEAAGQALERIFTLGDLDLDAEVLQGEERLEIEVWGEDQEKLLEDRGRLLLAIEHLLPRLIRGFTGESSPCRVDCDNFHEIRAEQLRDMAQRAASEVRERGRPKTLAPMSPDERRIIHLTLNDDPAVETESQGNGLFKRVTVRPVSGGSRGPRGFDPYRR